VEISSLISMGTVISFLDFYNNNGRQAGTYTFEGNGPWVFQP